MDKHTPYLSQQGPAIKVNHTMQHPTGMPCPVCNGFIPTSIQELIAASSITCPHCGLRLDINMHESRRAIDALKKVQASQDRINSSNRC